MKPKDVVLDRIEEMERVSERVAELAEALSEMRSLETKTVRVFIRASHSIGVEVELVAEPLERELNRQHERLGALVEVVEKMADVSAAAGS